MMNISIIAVGKLKESYWRDAIAEYSKRISRFAHFEIVELPESRLSDNPSDAEIFSGLENEAKLMQPYLEKKGAYNIAMCVEGKLISSEELASEIASAGVNGFSNINFFIGSSFGLSDSVKKSCKLRILMSRMTLPHQLARVVLSEQIYRALTINAGIRYHK
ncbi:MAG: 23S rRNA (pseudouridine(1915)-N(3))-methyltransferase RlmH [Oscillospiraceae bacterium]|nr:23S rRNA (pseudouridine(1915)-N(3))-methyltransferase RlmH [Oscillospiraceae bacterium]